MGGAAECFHTLLLPLPWGWGVGGWPSLGQGSWRPGSAPPWNLLEGGLGRSAFFSLQSPVVQAAGLAPKRKEAFSIAAESAQGIREPVHAERETPPAHVWGLRLGPSFAHQPCLALTASLQPRNSGLPPQASSWEDVVDPMPARMAPVGLSSSPSNTQPWGSGPRQWQGRGDGTVSPRKARNRGSLAEGSC